jgi:site-specific recombinase XerD
MVTKTQLALRRAQMDRTVANAINDFIDAKRAENLSPKTLHWYRWLLEKFAASLDDQRLASLSLAQARVFVAELQARNTRYEDHPISPRKEGGLSDYTVSAYVRTLKVFSHWLADEGYTKADLFARLKRPKVGYVPFGVGTKRALDRYLNTFRPDSEAREVFLSDDGTPLTYNGLKAEDVGTHNGQYDAALPASSVRPRQGPT